MAANESTKYTHFSNVEVGTASGGGGFKVSGVAVDFNNQAQNFGVTELTAASTLTAADNGTVYTLNSATEFATTLPAPAAGLRFKFIVLGAPSGASYTIVTNGGANIIQGAADVASTSVPASNEDTITFTAGTSITGDWVDLISDGTNWYVSGHASVATAIAFTAT